MNKVRAKSILPGEFPNGPSAPPVAAPVTTDQAEALKSRIQEALVEVRQAKQWIDDDYGEMGDRAEIEIMEAKLKSELTVINHFLATGEWSPPEGSAFNPNGTDANGNLVRDLNPGWNGDMEIRTDAQNGGGITGAGTYAGTIYIKDTNDPTRPPQIAFQLSPDAVKLEAFNRGADIIYVETYKDDAGNLQKRYWIGKEHVTRVDAQIAIDAHPLNHGVQIDLSRAYRISDRERGSGIAYGTTTGFIIVGSDYQDTINGSQGSDYILGLKDTDKLYGMGGTDTIYGDDDPYFAQARASIGLRTDLEDGDDLIDGGAGRDILEGGGGINHGYDSDPTSGPGAESKNNIQTIHAARTEAPDPTFVLGSDTRGWESREAGRGVIEIEEDTSTTGNSVLSLNIPTGYDMAFGEPMTNGRDLKITFVGHSENGAPKTFTVIVRNALGERTNSMNDPLHFKFNGNGNANIIDFHSVNFGNALTEFNGFANDDMILAPKNDLSQDGVKIDDLLNSHNRTRASDTRSRMETIVPISEEDADNIDVGFDAQNNELVVSRSSDNDSEQPVSIDSTGYDKAYAVEEGDDLLVILVKRGLDGEAPETRVIRFKNYQEFMGATDRDAKVLSWLSVGSQESGTLDPDEGQRPDAHSTIDIIPLIVNEGQSGNIIRGGEGNDFAFAADGDSIGNDVETEVSGHYSADGAPELNPNPNPTPASEPASEEAPATGGDNEGGTGESESRSEGTGESEGVDGEDN